MKTIRVHLTVTFDETKITAAAVKDRLDSLLNSVEFSDVVDDWHTRWVADLADAPLHGAAKAPAEMARLFSQLPDGAQEAYVGLLRIEVAGGSPTLGDLLSASVPGSRRRGRRNVQSRKGGAR